MAQLVELMLMMLAGGSLPRQKRFMLTGVGLFWQDLTS